MGTLLAYILVTFAVLFMRYVHDNPEPVSPEQDSKIGFAEGRTRGLSRDRHQDSSSHVSEPTSSCDNASTYDKIRGSPSKQPKMSRFRNSPSSKRVTFSSSLHVHTDGRAAAPTGTKSTNPDDHIKESYSLKETALVGNSASSRVSKQSSKTLYTSMPSHSEDSHFKTLGFHPLLDNSSSNEEDELLASEDVLFQRLLSPDTSNERGVSRVRKNVPDKNPEPKSQKSNLRKLLMETQDGRQNKSNLPLWLKLVTDVVDSVSVSPGRTLCLLCAIYGVEIVICIVLIKLWQAMADGSIVSLGLLGFLSAILLVLVGIISFMPQSM